MASPQLAKILLITTITLILLTFVKGQVFHPYNDKIYLDMIESNVRAELEQAKLDLGRETTILKNLTEAYIAANIKKNIYKNLEGMPKEELKSTLINLIAAQPAIKKLNGFRLKSPRQEGDAEAGVDPVSLELGSTISGIVFRNLQVIAHMPTLLLESLKKGFPQVFGTIAPKLNSTSSSQEVQKTKSLGQAQGQKEVTDSVTSVLWTTINHVLKQLNF